MTKSLIISIIFVFVAWRVIKRLARGPKRTLEQLQKAIDDLYHRGFSNGTLIIENVSGKKFVQLSKYIKSKKHKGLHSIFPTRLGAKTITWR